MNPPQDPDAFERERLEDLVQALDAIVWEANPESLRFSFVSRRAEQILGFPPSRWVDEPGFFASRIHPHDREATVAAYRAAVRADTDASFEYRVLDAGGKIVWLRDRVQVQRGEGGRPARMRGVMVEITQRRATEEALRESEDRYRQLVQRSPDAILVHGDGHILFANTAAAELLRASGPESLVGMPALTIVPPGDREIVAKRMREEELGDQATLVEERFVRLDGSEVEVEVAGIPVRFQGAPARQIVARDISERKATEAQLQETEARYRALVEQIPAVLYVDEPGQDDRTIYISPQVEVLLGLSQEQWMQDPELWREHLHPDDADDAYLAYRRGVAAGRPFSHEYRMVTPRGTVWIRDDATVLDVDGHTVVQGVMFDITEQKLAEAALLESEGRERQAASQLRALDAMKNTFLAAVSHELRSPLTAVLGLAITLEHQEDLGVAERRDLLQRLSANARKLDRLLTDLLDLDRLARGTISPQRHTTDVGALVRRCVESIDVLAEHEVRVQADPVVASVDAAKIERIVENLLVNAARHTEPGSTIWVRVGHADGQIQIAVEDDGPGILEELREDIFQPFRQGASPATAHSPGTGVGLSLVSEFARLHGGRAWVENRPEGGAAFHVSIPDAPDENDQPVPEPL